MTASKGWVSGATQSARILPVKIARDPGNNGGFLQGDDIATAVYYAAGAVLNSNNMITGSWRGADILVNSWGGGAPNGVLTAAFNWAVTQGRDGRGVTSFNASGNGASGTVPQLNYQVVEIPVTPGQKQYIFSYQTNGDTTFLGENRAWVADIVLPDGTQELLDDDNSLVGWTSNGNQPWTIADDPVHAYGTARFVARAGFLTGASQVSNLTSPVVNVTNNSTLQFARYISSQLQFDQFGSQLADVLAVFESTNGGQFVQVFGNAGNPFPTRPVQYPASLASTISVGASTDWDYRSAYSQFGTALDIVAPSGGGYANITTTDRTGAAGYDAISDYTSTFSGTSAATPLAAGIAALVLSTNSDLTTAQIRTIMQSTADKIGGNNGFTAYTNGFNQFYGFGKVNATAAVDTTLGTRGDFDRDQDVDGADFLTWQRSFGATADPVGTGADGDLSGEVDSGDLTIWQDHYGESIPAPLVAASTTYEAAASEIPPSLPSNFFVTLSSNATTEPGNTLANVRSEEIGDSASRDIVFESLDLLPSRTTEIEELYFASRREDSEQSDGIDEVFQTIGVSLFDEVA